MARKIRNKYLVLALRRVGTDNYADDYIAAGATPQVLQTSGVKITPLDGEEIDRDLDDGGTGNSLVMMVGDKVKITGKVEISGSGTNNLPTKYAALHQICGRVEAINGAIDVGYARVTDGSELDACVYFYMDGALHKAFGVRGKRKATYKTGEIPYYEFELLGIYGGIVSGAFSTPDFTGYQKPVKVGKTYTSFTLDGSVRKLIEIELDDGNEVNLEEYVGYEEVLIGDFKPTGKMVIEAPDLSVFDPFAIARSEAIMPFVLTHGTAAGFIVKESSTSIQLGRPEYGDRNGTLTYEMPFRLIEDTVTTTS